MIECARCGRQEEHSFIAKSNTGWEGDFFMSSENQFHSVIKKGNFNWRCLLGHNWKGVDRNSDLRNFDGTYFRENH